jgi:hypothetical protein
MDRIMMAVFLIIQTLSLSSCQQNLERDSSEVRFTVANRSAKNFALVVGSPNDLPGVSRDVENVSKMIRESNLGYELMKIDYAGKPQILTKGREIGSRISADSTIFFFFAGHGADNGQLVSQGNGMFTLSEVVAAIKSGSSLKTFRRFIAVIDACHSGQSVNGSEAMFLAGAVREFSMEKFISGMVTGESSGSSDGGGLFTADYGGGQSRDSFGARPFEQGLVIAAAKASQYSVDGGASIGGIFTASLMNAIRSNSTATLSEILESARRMTLMRSTDQTPLWKATPESILNERFNRNDNGGVLSSEKQDVAPQGSTGNNAQTQTSPQPETQIEPTPGPNASGQSDNGGNNTPDFLQFLISILKS